MTCDFTNISTMPHDGELTEKCTNSTPNSPLVFYNNPGPGSFIRGRLGSTPWYTGWGFTVSLKFMYLLDKPIQRSHRFWSRYVTLPSPYLNRTVSLLLTYCCPRASPDGRSNTSHSSCTRVQRETCVREKAIPFHELSFSESPRHILLLITHT